MQTAVTSNDIMEDIKTRVVSSVINFLRAEFEGAELSQDNREGLEVAIQCLENVYDVGSLRYRSNEPNLTEIYKYYLHNPYLHRRVVTDEEKAEAESLKTQGNSAMIEGRYTEALQLYTRAIECDPRNSVYYCNRAAAKSRMGDHTAAVRDCQVSAELDPGYSKAFARMGLAYCGLERYVHAVECYQKAHELDPTNEGFRGNLQLAKERVRDMCALGEEAPTPPPRPTQPPPPPPPPPEPTSQNQTSFNINAMLNNPQVLSLASQVLGGPAMQTLGPSFARAMTDIFSNISQSFSPDPDEYIGQPPDSDTPDVEPSRNF